MLMPTSDLTPDQLDTLFDLRREFVHLAASLNDIDTEIAVLQDRRDGFITRSRIVQQLLRDLVFGPPTDPK